MTCMNPSTVNGYGVSDSGYGLPASCIIMGAITAHNRFKLGANACKPVNEKKIDRSKLGRTYARGKAVKLVRRVVLISFAGYLLSAWNVNAATSTAHKSNSAQLHPLWMYVTVSATSAEQLSLHLLQPMPLCI